MTAAQRLTQEEDTLNRIEQIMNQQRRQMEYMLRTSEQLSERLSSLWVEATKRVEEARIELAESYATHQDPHPELRLVWDGPRGA